MTTFKNQLSNVNFEAVKCEYQIRNVFNMQQKQIILCGLTLSTPAFVRRKSENNRTVCYA